MQDKDYEKLGITPPTIESHGTEAEIKANMEKLQPKKWRLEGNRLLGDTEWGELCQIISSDLILKGTDDQGLPILEKVVL